MAKSYYVSKEKRELLKNYYSDGNLEELRKAGGFKSMAALYVCASRLGLKRDDKIKHEIVSKTQKELMKKEKLYEKWGLPRKRKWYLSLCPFSRPETQLRYRAKVRYGYIIGAGRETYERHNIYYNENTKRNKRVEKFAEGLGFRFLKLGK